MKNSLFDDFFKQNDELFFPQTRQTIRAIPVIYPQLHQKKYNSPFNKTFALRGYKHLSKITAVGQNTDENLKKIRKSHVKTTRSVEFDPYLCDISGLKSLVQVLMKLKTTITRLTLIIKRTKTSKEVDNLSFCLSRIMRLTKLRLELASSLSISQDSLLIMKERLRKCYGLKSVDTHLVYLQNAGQRNYRGFIMSYSKLLKLEEMKHQIFTNHTPQNEYKDIPAKLPNLRRLKRFFMKSSAKTGWTSMTDGAGQFLPVFLRSFSERLNPIHYTHIFTNFAIPTEAIEEYAKMLPQLLRLKHFFVEFSYCQLGDLELMILAEGFTHCKQIEHLTFKFIERTTISSEYVCQFVKIIAEVCSFASFELFFRKLKCPEDERAMILQILSEISNIKYVFTQESLSVEKKKV